MKLAEALEKQSRSGPILSTVSYFCPRLIHFNQSFEFCFNRRQYRYQVHAIHDITSKISYNQMQRDFRVFFVQSRVYLLLKAFFFHRNYSFRISTNDISNCFLLPHASFWTPQVFNFFVYSNILTRQDDFSCNSYQICCWCFGIDTARDGR